MFELQASVPSNSTRTEEPGPTGWQTQPVMVSMVRSSVPDGDMIWRAVPLLIPTRQQPSAHRFLTIHRLTRPVPLEDAFRYISIAGIKAVSLAKRESSRTA